MSIPPEMSKGIQQLIATLHQVRGQPQDAPVLFVGSATSTVEGRPVMDELRRQVLLANWGADLSQAQLNRMSLPIQLSRFNQTWPQVDRGPKHSTLRSLYEKLCPTDGHIALALLITECYFPLVMTSAIDSLVEYAVISAAYTPGEPIYQATVLVNGRDNLEDMQEALQLPTSSVILKLSGDFNAKTFALTQREIEERLKPVERILEQILARDVVIVGFTPLDNHLLQYFPKRGGSVRFIGTEYPEAAFVQQLDSRRPIYLVDECFDFDFVLRTIAQRLDLLREAEETTGESLSEETLVQIVEKTKVDQPSEEVLVQIIMTEQQPIVWLVRPTVFTTQVKAGRKVTFDIAGEKINYASNVFREWDVDVDDLNVLMQDMGRSIAAYHQLRDQAGRDSWRRQAKREGVRLYDDLMRTFPELGRKLDVARSTIEDPENLTLAFSGPRHYLGMPYEFLHDGQFPLAVRHPLCRQVTGVTTRHTQNFDAFVNALRQQEENSLRVLFIASDTGNISADKEINELESLVSSKARQAGINVDVDCLLTAQAGLDDVKEKLSRCAYHIVHYAGHGKFDEATGENSGLLFWRGRNRSGKPVVLTTRDLADLLTASQTRLFYVSACVGAQVGEARLLRDNDYLGVMDALVQVGIPYVLGFRWRVTDSGSRRFAALFYEQLFSSPFTPEQAVLHARRKVYGSKGTDETWVSPILVAQEVYRG